MAASKMPAESVKRAAERIRQLDVIALPLIEKLGIANAYRYAMGVCPELERTRNTRRAGPQGSLFPLE